MAASRKLVKENLRGVVDSFDSGSHYGFIRTTIYVNRRDIETAQLDDQRRKSLSKDQNVTFDLCEGPRGLIATNVRVQEETRPISSKSAYGLEILQRNIRCEIIKVAAEKKYCIVDTKREDFKTLLGHFSDFQSELASSPKRGDVVVCDIAKKGGKDRPVALKIRLIKSSGAEEEVSGLRVVEKGIEGKVLHFKKDRGFGIIETEKFGTLLCHYTNIKAMSLHANQRVVCDVAENRKKTFVAINLTPKAPAESDREAASQALDAREVASISDIKDELLCNICLCELENPVVTPCDHLFCWECIRKSLELYKWCPVDRRTITVEGLKEASRAVRNILGRMN